MKVSPINNFSGTNQSCQNIQQTKKSLKISNPANPAFNGYKEVLKDSFDKALDNKWDLGRLYQTLFDSAMSTPGAVLTEKGDYYLIHSLAFSNYKNYDNMRLVLSSARLDGLDEFYSLETLLKVDNTPLITRCRKTIEFSHPQVDGSIEFWRGEESMDFYIKRPQYKEGFYDDDNGCLKERTIYTDWCTPTTTYYNKDGSEKKLRSFLGSIGF